MSAPQPGQSPVHAFLDGPDQSMATIQRLFAGDHTAVTTVDQQWVLRAPVLDQLWGMGGGVPMHQAAGDLVRHLNAVGRAEESTYRNVRNTGRYERDGFTAVVVREIGVAVDVCAAASLTATDGASPPPAPGPAYLAAAARVPALREVLDILGAPEDLNAYDLWKVLEIVRAQVGGPDPRVSTPALTSSGLISRAEWDALGDAINNPATSGSDARHARYRSPGSGARTSLDQAGARVRRLVRDWTATL